MSHYFSSDLDDLITMREVREWSVHFSAYLQVLHAIKRGASSYPPFRDHGTQQQLDEWPCRGVHMRSHCKVLAGNWRTQVHSRTMSFDTGANWVVTTVLKHINHGHHHHARPFSSPRSIILCHPKVICPSNHVNSSLAQRIDFMIYVFLLHLFVRFHCF